ncbi:nucleotide sugar dehydrogenase [Aquibacillus sediminis]|uniref:nucleotide sugar dehydrogenase n=1 Tax=Aquibacillus sediminis TaxID=2574734 RepID=UPI001AEEE514
MEKVCVVGLGYIGLPTSAMFAKNGIDVLGVDVDEYVVDKLNNGMIHIVENGLGELVKEVVNKGKLRASTKPDNADCFILAVPTPIREDASANIDYVKAATESILPYLKQGDVIIVESTIPPRTVDDVVAPILKAYGWNLDNDIFLAHCPERVLPGQILKELVENTRIVGGYNELSAKKAADVYRLFVEGEIVETTAISAEMSKLMENTFRDVNIALANELAKISEKLGVDALEVINLANKHPRVNLHQPGPGVGGHCLAVDPYFIIEKAEQESVLISDSRRINNSMPQFVVDNVKKVVSKKGKVTVLGLSYKGNVDDVRESPAVEIVELLLESGFDVAVHDPHVKQRNVIYPLADFDYSIKDSECILVLTDHNEFKQLNETLVTETMSNPLIIDTKNCVNVTDETIGYYNFGNLYKLNELVARNMVSALN